MQPNWPEIYPHCLKQTIVSAILNCATDLFLTTFRRRIEQFITQYKKPEVAHVHAWENYEMHAKCAMSVIYNKKESSIVVKCWVDESETTFYLYHRPGEVPASRALGAQHKATAAESSTLQYVECIFP